MLNYLFNHFLFYSAFIGPDEHPTLLENFVVLGQNMLNAILPPWSDSIAAVLDAVKKAEKD